MAFDANPIPSQRPQAAVRLNNPEPEMTRRDVVLKCLNTLALVAYVFSLILVIRYIRGQSSWKILFNAFVSGSVGCFLSNARDYAESMMIWREDRQGEEEVDSSEPGSPGWQKINS